VRTRATGIKLNTSAQGSVCFSVNYKYWAVLVTGTLGHSTLVFHVRNAPMDPGTELRQNFVKSEPTGV
jgi:hypothetical protein